MINQIKAVGKVMSVSDPFRMDETSLHLVTIKTNKGLFSIPVDDPGQYKINENVEVFVRIDRKDID